ncbi:helix-turn-helix domain-containing protein [Streptomyces sp. NPDC088923]|uniref:AlbA family DNA-binding domain-containing protein n=1 Tax=Streptomyces sp. NPDC088923 TaxID=3365913 RepID=UPI0038200D1D
MKIEWNEELESVWIDDGAYVFRGNCQVERDLISKVELRFLRETLEDSSRVISADNPNGVPIDFCVTSTRESQGVFFGHRGQVRRGGERETVYEFFHITEQGELAFVFYVEYPHVGVEEEINERTSLYFERLSVRIHSLKHYAGDSGYPPSWEIVIIPPEDWTVSQCAEVSEGVGILLSQRRANPDSALGAYTLVLSGRPDLLLGQVESDWLDVKQKAYGISIPSQKYEFACDVAAFANSSTGGILIVGISTEKDSAGRERLSQLSPCKTGSLHLQTYMQALVDRIVPVPEGLKVEVVPARGGDLLVAYVPVQPEELMPFLVKGAIISDRVSGSYFSIPQRIGSDKFPASAESVHSMLVAARAIFRLKSQG